MKFLFFSLVTQPSGGLFGNTNSTQSMNQQGSAFGQTAQNQNQNQTSGLNGANLSFGNPGSGGSIFPSQQPSQSTSMFGASNNSFAGFNKPAQSTGLFGNSNTQQQGLFAGKYLFFSSK
jgi:hypothetical protein